MSDQESGRGHEEDRTVTARSRRAALSRFASGNPSPPPPMPFFHTNSQHPSPKPFPRSPTASLFSVLNAIRIYSSLTTLINGSHPHPISGFAFLPPSHPYTEEAVKKEKSSAPRGDDGVDRDGQPVFVLGWRGFEAASRSDRKRW